MFAQDLPNLVLGRPVCQPRNRTGDLRPLSSPRQEAHGIRYHRRFRLVVQLAVGGLLDGLCGGRRALLHGNVVDGIKANRAMAIVQAYLLPGIVFGKVFKNPPKLTLKQKLFKLYVYLSMGVDMALNATK